jgi:nicotinate dehydrogenase subunit A
MSCTVLLDGRPQTACMVPVGSVAGQRVETVESLVRNGTSHPLVDSVIEEQAGQCGYCLPGILMRAKALLDRDSAPSRADIAAALDDHLCRCGAHDRILRAVERAAGMVRARA